MSCLVKLFEPNTASPPVHVDLTAGTIELVAVNEGTRANCSSVETNKALAGSAGYGADLQFRKDSIVYQVAISDTAGIYGGTTVSSLTGTIDGDLDVVLEKLPVTRISSGRATSAAQARQDVLVEPNWTAGEKQAVIGVIVAIVTLRGTGASQLISFVQRYEVALENLGIDYSLF